MITVRSMRQISAEILTWWRMRNDALTFYGQGVARGLAEAVARSLQHLEQSRDQVVRSLFLGTAEGSNLEERAAEHAGISRLGPSASSAVVTIRGDVSTVIPGGTELSSTSGITFETVGGLTIGEANPRLLGQSNAEALADKVLARSVATGAGTNVAARTITSLVTEIPGITSLSNPVVASGGRDTETDDELRARSLAAPAAQAQGTQAFFEALAQAADEGVLRSHVERAGSGVRLVLMDRSGSGFTAPELAAIQAYVSIRTKALIGLLDFQNMPYVAVSISASVYLAPGFTLQEAFVQAADALSAYLDWRTWPTDGSRPVDQGLLLAAVLGTSAIDTLDEESFTPEADVTVAAGQLPRLVSCQLTNARTGQTVGGTLAQSYL